MKKDIWAYTKENISEMMHKPLRITIQKYGSDEVINEVEGEIVKCTLALNPPYHPISFRVQTHDGELILSIAEINKISDL